jgi:outer membrane beta-barrel protein
MDPRMTASVRWVRSVGRVARMAMAMAMAAGAATSTARAADSGGGDSAAPGVASPAPGSGGASEETAVEDADACIDENVKADLFAKRKRRDVRDRLFQQTNRHELTALGGYYASDLFDGTYVVGGAYAYHMTEDFAIEAHAALTHIASSAGTELEQRYVVLGTKSRREILYHADLVWDPAHGKLRIGGAIRHFDLYFAAGAGVIDSVLSNDIAGNAAVGLKFFIGRAMAIRLDVRNYVYRQQLLARKEWVDDVTSTIGLSLFLPVTE